MVLEEFKKHDLWCWNIKHIFGGRGRNCFRLLTLEEMELESRHIKTISAENTNKNHWVELMFPAEAQTLIQCIKDFL